MSAAAAASLAGLAGMVVGEIEGSPAGVREVAGSWRASASVVASSGQLVGSARSVVGSWQGEAAQAFGASAAGLEGDLGVLADDLTTGAGALEAYAVVLEAAQQAATELRAQAATLVGQALGNPVATGPAVAALAGIAARFAALRAEVSIAATQAAAALTTTSLTSQGGAGDGGEETSYETTPLDDPDIAWIRRQADGNVSWPDVAQDGIGDCYLLATLQAYSQTVEGRQALRDRVRWDESQHAFVVTFYDGDKKVEIAVDDYYTEGNQENKNGYPSIINVYERAYAEYLKDHTRNNTLDGGRAGDAMEDISGEDATTIRADEVTLRWGVLGVTIMGHQHKYSEEEWEELEEAVEEGRPVVGSTSGGDFDGQGAEVEAVVDADGDGMIEPEEEKNPEQRLIVGGEWDDQKGPDGHAYTVVAVDEETVTLYNPWGNNPVEPDRSTGGGTIRISREDYERYFARTDIGQVP